MLNWNIHLPDLSWTVIVPVAGQQREFDENQLLENFCSCKVVVWLFSKTATGQRDKTEILFNLKKNVLSPQPHNNCIKDFILCIFFSPLSVLRPARLFTTQRLFRSLY